MDRRKITVMHGSEIHQGKTLTYLIMTVEKRWREFGVKADEGLKCVSQLNLPYFPSPFTKPQPLKLSDKS